MQDERLLAKIHVTKTDNGVRFEWEGEPSWMVAISDEMACVGVLRMLPWRLVFMDRDAKRGWNYYAREEYVEAV